jgi:hypothetical protein
VDDFRGRTTDVECDTTVDGGRAGASYEGGGNPAMLGRCPGCDEARLRVYAGGGVLVVLRLDGFDFKVGGDTTSGGCTEPTAELVGGADVFDRRWEMVPIVVELLIRAGEGIISERVESMELPRGRGPNFNDVGERS